jgi:hypothetical protein
MKNPPTLADACAMTLLDKQFRQPRAKFFRQALADVVQARKFMLDQDMSRYVAELSHSIWRGGLRKRNRMLDNVRQQARLPHALTWIELDFIGGYLPREKELGMYRRRDVRGVEPAKFGWLLQQHSKLDTSFRCIEFRSSVTVNYPNRAFIHPVAMAWSSTDDPIMWRQFSIHEPYGGGLDAEFVVGCTGYKSDLVRYTPAYDSEAAALDLLRAMAPPEGSPEREFSGWQTFVIPRFFIRDVWALLATLNDLPIKIEFVEPSKGYIARGSYKKFLKHSVVHLTVPETRWRKLVLKTVALLRRRAHQVRGHWRKDWRHPLQVNCLHDFDDEMVCHLCGGHKLWITEHQRGDASLGFVTHDYEVHHKI